MTIFFITALVNISLGLLILALTVLVVALTFGQIRKVVHSTLVDFIQLRSLWVQSGIDLNNNQVLAKLRQDGEALALHHRARMLDVEADNAEMPVRRERLGLLAALDEEAR